VLHRSLSPRLPNAPVVPVVGMGTSDTLVHLDDAGAKAVVAAALDAGTTLFDSSPMYGGAAMR
jgi:aryl-alcohol dehydrogenase-like predicted oxidoreductase